MEGVYTLSMFSSSTKTYYNMTKRLKNVSIFHKNDALFFQKGNNYLLSVQGEDVTELKSNIDSIESGDFIDNDYSYFLEMNGLIENEITASKADTDTNKRVQNTVTVSKLNNESVKSLLARISTEQMELKHLGSISTLDQLEAIDLTTIDLVIIAGSVFENEAELIKISNYLYTNNITQVCLAFELTGFSVGPIIAPSLNTCSLESYIIRRKVNSNSYKDYASFVQTNAPAIKTERIENEKWLDSLSNIVRENLIGFYTNNSSRLLGNVLTVDFEDFDMTVSKVLRVPYLEIYGRNNPVNAFN